MKVARVLNEAGITTFEALARANPTDLQQTLKAGDCRGWVRQAELTAKGDGEALNGYRVG